MSQFQETVKVMVEGMDKDATRVESAKFKALGQRNRVESEKEVRKIKRNELESLIKDKKDLLERLQLQVCMSVSVSVSVSVSPERVNVSVCVCERECVRESMCVVCV